MKKKYTIIIEKDEQDWFISDVVELPGCHTQAKSIDALIERTKEAIQAHLSSGLEEESTTFVGLHQIEV
ncbi:type II toxin-antitoxin system HicB family antitoxin [archaeon]|nr:type II toxin-antitoxin system HicB family antitoxin [archaeon]